MPPIKIDLRDLTDEHVAQAAQNLGACKYAAPCIIGTLIPEDQRARFDTLSDLGDSMSIRALVTRGEIEFAEPGQADAAQHLQSRFDLSDRTAGYRDEFFRLANEWVNTCKS